MEIEGFGGVPAGFNRAEAEVIAEERFFGDAEFDAKLGHDVDFMAAFSGIIPAQKDRIDFFILIQRGGGLDAVAQDAGRFSVQINAGAEDLQNVKLWRWMMIEELYVKGMGGIKFASLFFSGDFIAITGESGAGKSSLVRAFEFISGKRADRRAHV